MAYFLKKLSSKGRTYLSICESFYDPKRKGTAHRTYKSLSSVESLKENGIIDPIAYYQEEVNRLNNERKLKEVELISESSPVRYIGYFLCKAILEKLEVKKVIDLFKLSTDYDFDLYEVLSSLVYARLVKPCSKLKSFHDVIPYLGSKVNFTYYQLLEALRFYGNDYEKFVELFTKAVKDKYDVKTDITYFDCTNFYFEIDKEDNFRKKGPSKENRKDPVVGLGLLLDANQIPIGMKLYPGNESEKPVLRKIISELKTQNNIEGKTVHVADKGLNCAKNIYAAKANGDGYLFSKSVKQLPEKEKTWVLLQNDYKYVKDENGQILYKYKSCIDEFPYDYSDDTGKTYTFKLKEKRLVTYNPSLAKKKIYEIDRMAEKARALCASKAKKEEFGESGKYVEFKGKDGSKVQVSINEDKIRNDKTLAGYNLLVTSELKMKDKDMYDTYHNLWRIEESFRIMKSDLDARPVFVQSEESIKGHFLVCYIAVLLERILQFKVFKNKYPSSYLYDFFKEYKLVKSKNEYTNITSSSRFIDELAIFTGLPLKSLYLTEKQFNRILSYKI